MGAAGVVGYKMSGYGYEPRERLSAPGHRRDLLPPRSRARPRSLRRTYTPAYRFRRPRRREAARALVRLPGECPPCARGAGIAPQPSKPRETFRKLRKRLRVDRESEHPRARNWTLRGRIKSPQAINRNNGLHHPRSPRQRTPQSRLAGGGDEGTSGTSRRVEAGFLGAVIRRLVSVGEK